MLSIPALAALNLLLRKHSVREDELRAFIARFNEVYAGIMLCVPCDNAESEAIDKRKSNNWPERLEMYFKTLRSKGAVVPTIDHKKD